MTRDHHPTTAPASELESPSDQCTAAIKSPRPQRAQRWASAPPPNSLVGAAGREMSPASLASLTSNERKKIDGAEASFCSARSSVAPHVEGGLERIHETGIGSKAELLKARFALEKDLAANHLDHERFSSVDDLMKQSMAIRQDFEKPSAFPEPFISFIQTLPTPDETPTHAPHRPATPWLSPRRSATPFMESKEQMTPAPSPESTDDEIEAELELSVGRLGLNRKSVNGGNSPSNERVEDEDDEGKMMGDELGEEGGYELSFEDLAILDRAAAILRGQVRHFEKEINANINQQVRNLYKDSFDPPDIADMDSMPDFHLRNNPHAPNAIVKTVQVCCAVERGLAAILEVQRGSGEKGKVEESLMEICVKRPIVTGREMQSAVKGIAKTVGYGGREKRGSSIEWKK